MQNARTPVAGQRVKFEWPRSPKQDAGAPVRIAAAEARRARRNAKRAAAAAKVGG